MTPFDILGLPTTATETEVKAAWQALAAVHHPDKGGDSAMFKRIRDAYNEAMLIAAIPKVCARCGGSGRLTVTKGFNSISVACPRCS